MFENYVEGSYQLVPVPIAFVTQSGVIGDVNRAFVELLTCTVTDVVGRQLADLARDPLSAGRIHEHTLHIGPVKGLELLFLDRNRGEIPASVYTTLMRSSQGQASGYLLVAVDLRPLRRTFKKDPTRLATEDTLSNTQEQLSRASAARDRAERALASAEKNWNSISQLTLDGVAILQEGTIKYANSRFAQLVNAGGTKIEGTSLIDYVELTVLNQIMDRAQRPDIFAGSEPSVRTRLTRLEGADLPVDINASPGAFDGKPAALLIVRPVEAEAPAPASAPVPAAAAEAAPGQPTAPLLFAVDRDGRFTFRYAVNPDQTRLLPENVNGRSFGEVLPPEASRLTAQALERNQRKETVEYEYRVPNGRQATWFRTRLTPVLMNGAYAGSFAEVWDISERKRKERAEEIRRRNRELQRRITDMQTALKQLQSFTALVGEITGTEAQGPTTADGELAAPLLTAEDYLAELPEEMRRQLVQTQTRAKEMQALIDGLMTTVKNGELEAERIEAAG
jgi:PAS domain S-box-containing protein